MDNVKRPKSRQLKAGRSTVRKTISLRQDLLDYAIEQSEELSGRVNMSAYLARLIHRDQLGRDADSRGVRRMDADYPENPVGANRLGPRFNSGVSDQPENRPLSPADRRGKTKG